MQSFFKLFENISSQLYNELYSDIVDRLNYEDEDNDDDDYFEWKSKSFDKILNEIHFHKQIDKDAYVQALISLLKSGVEFDINERDIDYRQTILMAVTTTGRLDLVKALVKKGADVNARDEEGSFALKLAATYGYPEIFSYLAPLTDSELYSVAKPMLHSGVLRRYKIESQAYEMVKAFTGAAFYGNIEAVSTALSRGVNINAIDSGDIDSSGKTALLAAIRNKKDDVVQFLLKAGANPNIKEQDERGRTPLIVALEQGSDTAFQMLLEAGADINESSNCGETALMSAVWVTNLAAVRQLLQMGADTKLKHEDGTTALDRARMFVEQFPEDAKAKEILKLLDCSDN